MLNDINGYTRTCGLIGNPVEHTLSPVIHNTLSMVLGENLAYVPFHVENGRLEDAVKGAFALNLLGLNVTVPYKSDVIPYLTDIDPLAENIGAVNTNDIVMADDSGLEIDYLNKEPGIYSARYLGEDTPYSVKNANLIQRLEGVPEEQRTARFVCAIAAVLPDGRELTIRAAIEGRIGYDEKGKNGFGYDPIFYVPEFGKTTAELTEEEKNQVSHRGKALQLMKEELKKYENIDRK